MEEGRFSADNKMHLDSIYHVGLSYFLYLGKNIYLQGVHLANSADLTKENINNDSV